MFEKVRQVIAESLGIRESDVKLDSSFVSLGADSLEMAQLVLDLEEAFHIEILDDDLNKLLRQGPQAHRARTALSQARLR